MKPLGLALDINTGLRVVRPDDAQDAIYKAVEKAIEHGMTVRQFRAEAAECWDIVLRDHAKDAQADWDRP